MNDVLPTFTEHAVCIIPDRIESKNLWEIQSSDLNTNSISGEFNLATLAFIYQTIMKRLARKTMKQSQMVKKKEIFTKHTKTS